MDSPVSGSSTDAFLQALAARLESRVDDLVEIHMRQASEDQPQWVGSDRPELHETQRRLARDSFLAEIGSLRHGARIPTVCPPQDLEYARNAARLGAPREIITYPYRLGQQVQWQEWLDLVEEAALQPGVRRALLDRGSRFFFAYANRVSEFVTEEYAKERERIFRGEEERRRQIVSEVLTGEQVHAAGLGYDLEAWHVGVIVQGPEPAHAISELARIVDRRPLRVAMLNQTWGWLGGARPLGEAARRALEEYGPPVDAAVAVGADERGLEGFRRTHQQAGHAFRAAAPGHSTYFDKIALEALATRDEAAASEFVARELNGLLGEDTRSSRLRETLRVYFGVGQNAALTAKRLGIHEQTVAQRLRAVEQRTGRQVAGRRAELETALRIQDYLDLPR